MDVTNWRKSRHSDGQGGACVEVARLPRSVAIRDSKDPEGPKIALATSAFRIFLDDLKH